MKYYIYLNGTMVEVVHAVVKKEQEPVWQV